MDGPGPSTLAFQGPHAVKQYGGPIELTGGQGGYYHLGNPKGIDDLADDLMAGPKYAGVGRRKSVSQLDLAILRDLGWQPLYRVAEKDTGSKLDIKDLKDVSQASEDDRAQVDPDQLEEKKPDESGDDQGKDKGNLIDPGNLTLGNRNLSNLATPLANGVGVHGRGHRIG